MDDEESIRTFADGSLRNAGYDTTLASSATEALAIAEQQDPFDLVLADLMMPDMQGDELARRLRQLHPDLKILYLTGWSPELFKERTTLWEDEAFLDKPTTEDGLLEAVSLILFGHMHGSESSGTK